MNTGVAFRAMAALRMAARISSVVGSCSIRNFSSMTVSTSAMAVIISLRATLASSHQGGGDLFLADDLAVVAVEVERLHPDRDR